MEIILSLGLLALIWFASTQHRRVRNWLGNQKTQLKNRWSYLRDRRHQTRTTSSNSQSSAASQQLQNQLVHLFAGNRQQAEQLVAEVRFGQHGKSEAYYWSLAIQRKRYIMEHATLKRQADSHIRKHASQSHSKNLDVVAFQSKRSATNKAEGERTSLPEKQSEQQSRPSVTSNPDAHKVKAGLETARGLAKQRKFELALSVVSRLIKERPNCIEARMLKGNILRDQGNLDRALIEFDAVLSECSGHLAARSAKGIIEYEKRDYRSAIVSLSNVINRLPSAKLLTIRASAHKGLGHNDEALNDFQRAQKIYECQGASRQVRQINKQVQILHSLTTSLGKSYRRNIQVEFPFENGRPADQKHLLSLLNGDHRKACRLLELNRSRHPSRSVDWYFEKTIHDVQRDRG